MNDNAGEQMIPRLPAGIAPQRLADLLELDHYECRWSDTELRELWRQQLASSVVAEVAVSLPEASNRVARLCRQAVPPVTDIASLLNSANPPAELLDLVRRMAKLRAHDATGSGLGQVSAALYLAAIVRMRLAGDLASSKLSQDELAERLDWALHLPWLDDRTHAQISTLRATI